MKVFFIVPRYHTNMVGWINTLKYDLNCSIEVHSTVKGHTENYSEVIPIIFNKSIFSRLLIRIFGDHKANSPKSFPQILAYFNYLKRQKPDYIVVRDISRYFSLLAAICSRILGIKLIIYSQIIVNQKYSKKRLSSINFVNRIFKAIWLSPLEGHPDRAHKIPEKLRFVPFVVPPKNVAVLTNKEEAMLRILTIGKFVRRKNLLILLDAISRLIKKGYKLHLTIIGEVSKEAHNEYYDRVLSFIEENNLIPFINVLVNVEHSKIDTYYQAADLFVLPATNEPASISVLESIANGVPVICSNNCGTRFYIQEGYNGFIFDDNDLDSLIDTLEKYLVYKDRGEFSQNCLKTYHDNLSPDAFKDVLCKVIQKF